MTYNQGDTSKGPKQSQNAKGGKISLPQEQQFQNIFPSNSGNTLVHSKGLSGQAPKSRKQKKKNED